MKNNIKYFLIAFLLFTISCSNYKVINPFGSDSNTATDSTTTTDISEDNFISGPDATDFDIEYNMRMYKEKFGIYKIIISGDISKTSTLTYVKTIMNKDYYKTANAEIEVDLTKTTLTEITADTFKDSTTLKAIYLPSDAASIKASAFSGCTALSTVSFNSKLTTIEANAFDGCTALSAVTLNSELTTIGDNAFNGCTALSTVTLNNKLTTIGANAFSGCTALTSISFPESLTTLDADSFNGCSKLANLEYAGTKTGTIAAVTLNGVDQLKNLYLPNVASDPGDNSWDNFLGITWTQINYGSSIPK
ncbi:hypothetical protein A966_06825 [Brachyspira hampsonii 30446]|uniref:Surface antigen BspA-like protein n=1 Tax=Brachyspira hampsonii 30446 TaxID=1289135 RepID=A0A2U4FIW7_9SPIR|nr:leucine-rich repeat domain-containing protein [Brachyspira hampsonii]EKV57161.1 hypothetical protein A966_06825 [Brachyspira hampsonii 30446]MBW5395656.1 leucine-rich repeat domain-containing protein [Brachyspira hampsonii]OEJ20756.1 hypothetical protein A9495_10415 [Brachyspira hampsonii]